MSSEIYYDRAFIRVEDRFIPVVNQGSSNCFEISFNGQEIPEKAWWCVNYPFKDRQIFTAEEIRYIAEMHDEISRRDPGLMRKSRNRCFEAGEFFRWFVGGMKSAHTVEEYTEYGNTVLVLDCSVDPWRKIPVGTTEELLQTVEALSGKSISVSFENNRKVFRPHAQRVGNKTDFSSLPCYYVLSAESGNYYCKRSKKRIWFTNKANLASLNSHIRKFRTEKEALKYLDNNKEFLGKYGMQPEKIENTSFRKDAGIPLPK